MQLRDVVKKYLAVGGGFGRSVALADFGQDSGRLFSAFDEDYHISRFFHFERAGNPTASSATLINGFEYTHVSIDAEIHTIL